MSVACAIHRVSAVCSSEEATIFAFAAPIPHLQQVLDVSKPSHAFLAYGGFLYMTNDYKVWPSPFVL